MAYGGTARKIAHVDMDAFFAAVEIRDNPRLRGYPVIVGGPPEERSVVSTCSYEARAFGIHSAMPMKTALRLCPQAIRVNPHFERYQECSAHIREILLRHTPLIEPLSLDEAYLDLTDVLSPGQSATRQTRVILDDIRQETGLTASAGVSINKFLAKLGSAHRKPAGLTVIPPDRIQEFLDATPVERFFGIGPATARILHQHKIHSGIDLRRTDPTHLQRILGKSGLWFHLLAHGEDPRPVCSSHIRKSLGREITFPRDLARPGDWDVALSEIATALSERLLRKSFQGRTLTVKVRLSDFTARSRSLSFPLPISATLPEHLLALARPLLRKANPDSRPLRLIGLTLSEGTPAPVTPFLPFAPEDLERFGAPIP